MAKEICISSTPHETRLAILEDDQLTEIYYERENEYTLAGSIYKGRVTRVLPGMQSAFVDLGLERDAFLYVTDFMEEQEDSEDFEKVPNGNGNGSGAVRREAPVARESQPARESRESNRESRAPRAPISVEPESAPIEAESSSARNHSDGAKDEEFGEGTRRWRGRRGRRRSGRPQGPREGVPSQTLDRQPLDRQPLEQRSFGPGDAQPVEGYAFDEDESPTPSAVQTAQPVRLSEPGIAGADRSFQTEPAAAKFPSVNKQAASQPIVLPGESLSRYGGKAAPPRREIDSVVMPTASASTYKPSTLVEVLPSWDGGLELPGESLSRYRGKSAAPAASLPAASEIVEHAWEVGHTDKSSTFQEELPEEAVNSSPAIGEYPAGIDLEPDAEHSAESSLIEPRVIEPTRVEPAAVDFVEGEADLSEANGETSDLPEADSAHIGEATDSAVTESLTPGSGLEVPIVGVHEKSAEVAQEEIRDKEVQEEEIHDDPETASASYRIDPAAPSGYRVSPLVEVEPIAEFGVEETFVTAPTEIATPLEVGEPVVAEFGSSTSYEERYAGLAEPQQTAEAEHAIRELAEPSHTLDEISADAYEKAGAMYVPADSIGVETEPLTVEASLPQAGSAATVEELPLTSELPRVVETEFFEDAEDDEFAEGPRGFAPGLGTLEEELIEEDEYDSEPLHAYADDGDLDDLEEETLDNLVGAELSEMVRDAHLEQRIRVSPESAVEDEEADIEFGDAEGDVDDSDEEEGAVEEHATTSSPVPARRDGRTDDGRRGGRGNRQRRGGRPNGGGGGGSRRANSQLSDLPIISELLKQGQEILVQIAKEPIAKKGARITSHIALPGRFLVFMPTVNHVGVSRKISSDEERQRLKRILISEKGAASGGFIVRTAADGASEDDLRADIRFLISLWTDIKQRADDGKAPALIYHDLNLIERVLRDQVSANFSTIWVDNEAEYERIVRFLNRFEPSLVRRVKLYTKETPLFEQFGIQDEISKALKSKVWLKSGGSIVINQTEALVAIDINTGKYVGKTARLEDTILKTNLDAIPEIVRQIRLRDLGGIIVIDFIDMDDRRNRHKVMAALEEELKSDRAPSKVLQFNDFGLVAITRKRVKQSLERTLSVQCEICAGTGMVKSPTTVCNEIYTELRKMQKHLERGDVLLRVNPEVVKTLKSNNAKWLNELEEMTGKTIIVKSDPALHPEQFDIH